MRSAPLLALLASALAQDTSSDATECASYTSSSVAAATAINTIQSTYSTVASPDDCPLDASTSSYPSTMVGDYVEVSGIVTAVGTTKDAYSAAYYYIQMTDGTAEYAGIEVFKEDHTHLKGDTVTIKGVVRESFGVTEIVECFGTKTGTGTMPTPITVTTDDFQGCSLTAEKYEGMLVQTGEVTVQPCENQLTTDLIAAGSKGGYYCQANLENLEWPECFDKYKQMWVKSTGATGKPMEVDNHAVELAVEYLCATGPSAFATWTSLTGVMTFAYGTWDLIARDEFDVVGGTAKTPSSVGAASVTIMQILQSTVMYGNSDTVTGPYTVPPHVLGTGETNSAGVAGYGGYAMAGQAEAPWVQGSCPPYEVLDWMDDSGNKTQNLCSCYPPNYYDPNAGSNGGGTSYVTVTGVIQGIEDEEGPFYICDESCPTSGGCMFMYRRSSTKLSLGDKVQLTAKVYAYYGLNQFSYPIDITVIETNRGACAPTITDTVAPFTYESGCNAEAEQLEGTEVTVECLKVVMVGDDLDGDGTQGGDGDSTYHLQTHSCYPGGEKKYHCILKVEDMAGNQMLVDDGTFGDGTTCLFGRDCPGYTGKYVKVGDTFESISGFIDQRRGSHALGGDYGGYYGLMPHKVGGLTGWSSDGFGEVCLAKQGGLSTGAIIGIVVGALAGVVAGVAITYVLMKGKGKKADAATPTAKAVTIAKATSSATSATSGESGV